VFGGPGAGALIAVPPLVVVPESVVLVASVAVPVFVVVPGSVEVSVPVFVVVPGLVVVPVTVAGGGAALVEVVFAPVPGATGRGCSRTAVRQVTIWPWMLPELL
jgi:hypothetical protein